MKRTQKRWGLAGSGVVFLVFVLTAVVAWAYVTPIAQVRLTTDASRQSNPRISGTKVVYQDERNGNSDIYLYDLTTGVETQITDSLADQYSPAISGNKVVYEDWSDADGELWLYDLITKTHTQLTDDADEQSRACIDGNTIAFVQKPGSSITRRIWLYDLKSKTASRMNAEEHEQDQPFIADGKVVFIDYRDDASVSEVYCYDLAKRSESRVTSDTAQQWDPQVSGDNIVFTDNSAGNWDIHLYNLATKSRTPVTTNSFAQTGAQILGSKVVFTDFRSSPDVYLHDLESGEEVQLTPYTGTQSVPAMSWSGVVWEDDRAGNSDVYFGELLVPSLSASTPSVVSYGARARLTGTLKTTGGLPLADRTVTLQMSTNGRTWSDSSIAKTDSNGAFALTSTALTSARYVRANFKGEVGNLSAQSPARLIKPKVYLTRPSFGRSTLRYRKNYSASGYLKPKHTAGSTHVKIKAYRYERGKWRYKRTYTTRAYDYSSYSKYRASIKLPARGRWRLRAYHAADTANAATYSSYRYVTVK